MTPTEQAATMRQSAALLLQLADERDPPVPALYLKPFSPRSLWNAAPNGATLSSIGLSESLEQPYPYIPKVAGGDLSTCGFLARATDPPQVVACNDIGNVTIPHWPANVRPAAGSDGHADIIDPTTNRVHSFWLLSKGAGGWSCGWYGSVPLDGSGFGGGGRSSDAPGVAGLIRWHEINGDGPFSHALAMSVHHRDLSPTPGPLGWVPPATRSDNDDGTPNTGSIPLGARMMLPPDYDTSNMTPFLRRVADTLKTRGAIVVDRNRGMPYGIYVENDPAGVSPSFTADVSSTTTAELRSMRLAMRMVASVAGWTDANGVAFTPNDTILTPPSSAPPAGAVRIAGEGQAFAAVGRWYWYGANGNFASRWLPAGSYKADNATFGDPAVGFYKSAYRAA